MRNDCLNALLTELNHQGITDFAVEHGGKHWKVRIVHGGRLYRAVCPVSSSDWRAPRNAVSDLRRSLGLERVIRKSGRRKRKGRKRPAAERGPCPTPAAPLAPVKPDPWAALAQLREKRVELGADESPMAVRIRSRKGRKRGTPRRTPIQWPPRVVGCDGWHAGEQG